MKSLEELKALREKMQGQLGNRHAGTNVTRVVVGMATCGIASGARPVLNTMAKEVHDTGLENVSVVQTGCIGMCQYEPIVEVYEPDKTKVTYILMTPEKAMNVVRQHLIHGNVVDAYTLDAIDTIKQEE